MARKTVVETITFSDEEERRFQIHQMKPKDGHIVLERILRIAAPIIGALTQNLGGEEDGEDTVSGDLKKEGIGDAFDAFAENLIRNEGVLDWLVEKLKKGWKIETEEEGQFVSMPIVMYDDVFGGEYGAELDLVVAALKVNFSSFFGKAGGLKKLARRFVTPTRSKSSSPKTATSGSGD